MQFLQQPTILNTERNGRSLELAKYVVWITMLVLLVDNNKSFIVSISIHHTEKLYALDKNIRLWKTIQRMESQISD